MNIIGDHCAPGTISAFTRNFPQSIDLLPCHLVTRLASHNLFTNTVTLTRLLLLRPRVCPGEIIRLERTRCDSGYVSESKL